MVGGRVGIERISSASSTINFAHSSIYTTAELKQIQEVLEKLKNQKPIEKQKYKADNLLESGAVNQAILIYQSIIQSDVDESVDKKFYGRVYGCLGAAYGRMFLYEEAAKMYEAAFQICEEESMLKAYLYACSKYMDVKDYEDMLERSLVYREMNLDIQEILEEIEGKMLFSMKEDTLETWKEEYRKIGTGER